MAPKVSVIIACYNGAKVISKAIDSALAQAGAEIEVIVVDDGSGDTSREIVGAYAASHPVKLICHAQNKGIPGARNTGIAAATGEFIGFLDQDDLWYPERLSSALAVFAADPEDQVGLVFGVEETRDLETGALQPGRNMPPAETNAMDRVSFVAALAQSNFIPTAAALFRKTCFDQLGPLDEDLKSGIDDFDMFLRVARHFDVRHVAHVQAVRHVHGQNFTKLHRMVPDMMKVLARIAEEEPAVAAVASQARGHFLYLLGREQQSSGQYSAACQSFLMALRHAPTRPKHWAAFLLSLAGPLAPMILRRA